MAQSPGYPLDRLANKWTTPAVLITNTVCTSALSRCARIHPPSSSCPFFITWFLDHHQQFSWNLRSYYVFSFFIISDYTNMNFQIRWYKRYIIFFIFFLLDFLCEFVNSVLIVIRNQKGYHSFFFLNLKRFFFIIYRLLTINNCTIIDCNTSYRI